MKIAEVSKQYDISADTLRYYERIGLMRHVRRTESGIRDYTEQDCARIQFIKCMRGAGMSIESLIEYMGLIEEGASACLRSSATLCARALRKCKPALTALTTRSPTTRRS